MYFKEAIFEGRGCISEDLKKHINDHCERFYAFMKRLVVETESPHKCDKLAFYRSIRREWLCVFELETGIKITALEEAAIRRRLSKELYPRSW